MSTVEKTDRSLEQWLDLGDQSKACITIPESCGAQGETVSSWVKLAESNTDGAMISSMKQDGTSFSFFYHYGETLYDILNHLYCRIVSLSYYKRISWVVPL